MALLKIVTSEDELLRKKSREVDNINQRIITLLDDMKDTLAKAQGVGLAAPQVGILRRIFVIDTGVEEGIPNYVEFINPKIVKTSQQTETADEGCLSVPGKQGPVERPCTVTVEATDRNGKKFTYTGHGLMARCLCHEYDHLDGILYVDKALEIYDTEE